MNNFIRKKIIRISKRSLSSKINNHYLCSERYRGVRGKKYFIKEVSWNSSMGRYQWTDGQVTELVRKKYDKEKCKIKMFIACKNMQETTHEEVQGLC